MAYYIYSTLACDNKYTSYKPKDPRDMPEKSGAVLIKGGTGVADKRFVTPQGVVTEVTEDQMDILQKNPVFQMHLEKSFIKIEKKELKVAKVVADMNLKDPGSPLTPADYKGTKGPKPVEDSKDND